MSKGGHIILIHNATRTPPGGSSVLTHLTASPRWRPRKARENTNAHHNAINCIQPYYPSNNNTWDTQQTMSPSHATGHPGSRTTKVTTHAQSIDMSLITMTELCLPRQRIVEWKPPPCCYWILYSIPVSRASKFASFKFVMHTAPRAVEYRSRLFMNRQTSGGWWDVRNTL